MSIKYKDQTIAGRTIAYLPNADVYSTEETVVGQWIDGKPVYRKIFVGILPTASNTVLTSDGVYETLINQYGEIAISGIAHPFPFFLSATVGRVEFHIEDNNISLIQYSYADSPFTAIIEYTKTTDTATIAIPTAAEMTAAYSEGVQSA